MPLKRTKSRVRTLLKSAKAELKEYEQALVDQQNYIQTLEDELENWNDEDTQNDNG